MTCKQCPTPLHPGLFAPLLQPSKEGDDPSHLSCWYWFETAFLDITTAIMPQLSFRLRKKAHIIPCLSTSQCLKNQCDKTEHRLDLASPELLSKPCDLLDSLDGRPVVRTFRVVIDINTDIAPYLSMSETSQRQMLPEQL